MSETQSSGTQASLVRPPDAGPPDAGPCESQTSGAHTSGSKTSGSKAPDAQMPGSRMPGSQTPATSGDPCAPPERSGAAPACDHGRGGGPRRRGVAARCGVERARATAARDERDARMALPMPLTFDLFGELGRRVPVPLAMTLFSIFDETVCRTVLADSCRPMADVNACVERWIRTYGKLRREWIAVAHEAVGDAGLTPLRVEALALARAVSLRSRVSEGAQRDLGLALGEIGPCLSAFAAARRAGRALDLEFLRKQSTRFDLCVAAALLCESELLFTRASFATPVLCAEARIAASRLREAIVPAAVAEPAGAGGARGTARGGASARRGPSARERPEPACPRGPSGLRVARGSVT